MNDLVCYLSYSETLGFSYGLKGVDLDDVIFSFYLLRNGKKYYVTPYQEKSDIEYEEKAEEGLYQAVGFFKLKLASGSYSNAFIIKSEPLEIKNYTKVTKIKNIVFNKRSIRLKEWGVNILKDFIPSAEYLKNRCSSLQPQKYRLKTNDMGFIINSKNEDYEVTSQAVFLGASQVESLYVEEGKRLSDQFQQGINIKGLQVLNGGYSGTTSLQILNTLLNKILQFKPAQIYFFLPTNDIYAFRNGGYWNNTNRFSPIMPEKSMKALPSLEIELWRNELHKIYSIIKNVCDIYNIKSYFMTFPHVINDKNNYIINSYSDKVAKDLIEDRKYLNSIFKDVISNINGNIIDLESLVDFNESYFYDDVHLNEWGCKNVAKILIQNSTFNEG